MEPRLQGLLSLCLLIPLFSATEARKWAHTPHHRAKITKRLDYYNYMGSPLSQPPYQDVLAPTSSPNHQDKPLYCVYPPTTSVPAAPTVFVPHPPPPPSLILAPYPPTSSTSTPLPPSSIFTPYPPTSSTSTPPPPSSIFTPYPPISSTPTPPAAYLPSPSAPDYELTPPSYDIPTPYSSPPIFAPGPPVFLPPVVYPPPAASTPPCSGTAAGNLWCVAKPSVPDPIILEAMNYACGSGADCDSIQSNGRCYKPDTMIAHASFAFNSYWQRTKVSGGTCDFGGTAMLITKDPSYDRCHFLTD